MDSSQNLIVLHPEDSQISSSVVFQAAPGHRITIGSNVIIGDEVWIIADQTDCVISNSKIGRHARVRNSRLDGVDAQEGSQVLESVLDGKVNDGYGFILERGFDFCDSNFAFSRGGVIKRIKQIYTQRPIHVPVGHSLVSCDEFERIQMKNSRRIRPVGTVDDCFVINSQYAHTEVYEQFYDPELFPTAYYAEDNPDFSQIKGEGIKIISMVGLNKEQIMISGDSTKIKEIQKQVSRYMKVQFEFQEGTITIERSGSPTKTGM